MRRVAALCLLLTLLPATPGSAGEPQGIAEMLERRAEAMVEGDRAGFLATVGGTAAFRERQARLFDGFRKLGVAEYRLERDPDTPELTADRERRHHGEGVRVFHVAEWSRLGGFDEVAAREDLFYTFRPGPGGWRIVADTDLDDLGLFSARRLWESGPIELRDSDRFRFVSHPDLVSVAETVLPAAERALDRLNDRWPLAVPDRILILAPSTTDELDRMITASFDLDTFVAFATSSLDRTESWRLAGHRMLLHWPVFSRQSPASREGTLVHELLHLATRDLAGPFVPTFVDEGVAEWASGQVDTSILEDRVTSGRFDGTLPMDHEFRVGDGGDILAAYQGAYSAMAYAADRWDPGALADFYRTLGRKRLAAGTWRYHVGRAMQEAFGVGLRRFERDWAASVEEGP